MIFPDKSAVLEIQSQFIERYGGIHGLRDAGALESALGAAKNRSYYEDASIEILAATYAFHLSQAHAFLDGNKRIAASKISREDVENKFAEWIIFTKENDAE